MALVSIRKFSEGVLDLVDEGEKVHIFEPEFHQEIYVGACHSAAKKPEAFQLSNSKHVDRYPNRGNQPDYADDDDDPGTIIYQGMIRNDGSVVPTDETSNICALKSISIRWGFVDFGVAR